ncbi:MAG: prepilin-type N-terminal cleavage/methylation domain-containing protein [Candidatus Woesebacteria bacterium]|nr:prepilin-type N-terminal cleavage/methylation domain-containing protein [Candidatus Woesebacteria bacterium]
MQLQSYKSLKEGYTLIELLVGITIISIVFTIGYAGFREFSRRQALGGVTKAIKADLRLTQQLASTGQKPTTGTCTQLSSYRFYIYSATSTYKIYANCSNPASTNILVKTVSLDSDISITLPPTPAYILFKVLGQGTNLTSDYIIELDHTTGDSSTVTVGTGGEIN